MLYNNFHEYTWNTHTHACDCFFSTYAWIIAWTAQSIPTDRFYTYSMHLYVRECVINEMQSDVYVSMYASVCVCIRVDVDVTEGSEWKSQNERLCRNWQRNSKIEMKKEYAMYWIWRWCLCEFSMCVCICFFVFTYTCTWDIYAVVESYSFCISSFSSSFSIHSFHLHLYVHFILIVVLQSIVCISVACALRYIQFKKKR